jgi:hypothetical protein
VSDAGAPAPRGQVTLYAVAFALLVASVWAQAKGNLESSLQLVWVSLGLSGLAMVLAAASVVLRPRARRAQPAPAPTDGGKAESG